MVVAIVCKASAACMELLIPRAMGSLIDFGLANEDIGYIQSRLIVMVALTLSAGICNVVAHIYAARYSHKSSAFIRDKSFEKIQRLKLDAVETLTIQSLMTRITGDADIIQRMLEMLVRPMVRGPLMIVGGLALALMTSAKLTFIIFAGMLGVCLVSYSIYILSNPLFRKIQHLIDKLTRIIRESLTGIRLIKVLNKEGYEVDRIAKTSKQIQTHEVKAGVFHGVLNPLVTLVANITLVITLLSSKKLITNGEITIGEVTAIIQYINMILMSMKMIPRLFLMLGRANVSAERVFDILDNKDIYQYGTIRTQDPSKNLLSVENLSFSYSGNMEILSNISFTLKKGEKIGILGNTGSGKSTLASLLLGLYPRFSGDIFLYGKSLFAYEREILRNIITAAPQKVSIYNASILSNIILNTPYDSEKLDRIIKTSQLQEFVSSKEQGTNFILEQNGKNLSGGQRQRINIARTLYRNAEIMIFDDISSGLDTKTEHDLMDAIYSYYPYNSFLFFSQKIQSVRECDTILLLDRGKIVAKGTHLQLLEDCPLYQQMWNIQNANEDF